METRKRVRIDVETLSSDDETPAKRYKKSPNKSASEEDAIKLLRSKKVFVFDPNISSFTLPQDCCTLEHIKRLNRALSDQSNHLKTFNMTPMSELMSFERVGSVLHNFSNNETLTALTFKHVSLNLTDLGPLLKKKRLQSLTISKMFELRSSIEHIIDDLIGCTSLTHLNLSYNKHLAGIDQVISKHKHLQSLILSQNNLRQVIPTITTSISLSTSLTHLELANTDLTDENAIKLAQVLENNQTITYLDISDNSFLSDPGFKAIIKMLGINRRITTLNIKGMPFNTNEVALFQTLETSNIVQCLTVSIKTRDGVTQLGIALEHWSALSDLTMSCNELGSVSTFLDGIKKNTTLKHLGMFVSWPNSEEGITTIKKAFESNRTLRTIKSSYHATLNQFFEQIAKRNCAAAEERDHKTIKSYVDEKDWQGMWEFIRANMKKGIMFEDLINEDDYTPAVYAQVLDIYLTESSEYHVLQALDEEVLRDEIRRCKTKTGTLQKKIESAQRKLDAAKEELKSANDELATHKSNRKKIQTEMQLEIRSRAKAEDACRKVKETIEAFSAQCNRHVMSWTLDEVMKLIRNLKLYPYTSVFADNLIAGDVLVKLTSPDLHQLGLTFMETKSIMSALYKLKHMKSLTKVPENSALRWTNNQVIEWLKNNSLGHLAELFRGTGITGNELVVLDNYDFVHWLQLKSIADKTTLEAAIQKLREEFEGPDNNDAAKKKALKQFLCPITHDIMKDPVSTIDGHTYERAAIESWLKNHDTSPLTNEKLASKILIPNHQLKSLIAEFAKE